MKKKKKEKLCQPLTEFQDRCWDLSVGPNMVVLPLGEFLMGSNDWSDTRPLHKVLVSKKISMGQYPVTHRDYKRFAEATGRAKPVDEGWGRGDRPVTNVTWEDANAYCVWLSEQTEESYRLPTEAEWEYAARAGIATLCSLREESPSEMTYSLRISSQGFVLLKCPRQVSLSETHPVGEKKPNPWGLYDMYGNVWQWCRDWYSGDYYANSPQANPQGPETGENRVIRGGECTALVRKGALPHLVQPHTGFRVVREL